MAIGASSTVRLIAFMAVIGFFATEVLQGLLRHLVGDSALVVVLYLPKIAMAALVFVHVAVSSSIYYRALPFICVVAIWTVIGLASTNNLVQTAFGLWSLVPVIFGFVFGRELNSDFTESLRWPLRILWSVAFSGVVLNYFVEVPWTGSELSVLGQTVEGSREWTTQGISRLAGFSRASFSVASQLLMFALLILFSLHSSFLRALWWLLTGAAIMVTTTKASIGAWILCSLYFLLSAASLKRVASAMPAVIAASAFIIPLFFASGNVYVDFGWLGLENAAVNLVLNSVLQRFTEGWPDAFHYVSEHGLLFSGAGIGGFGAAVKLFDPDNYNPGDNIMVGLYLTLGVWAFVPLAWFLARISPLRLLRGPVSQSFQTPLILALSSVALTTYVLEDPVMALLIGALTRTLSQSASRRPPFVDHAQAPARSAL